MKFINDIMTESVLYEEILNEKTGEKQMFITGPFMSYDVPNKNKRLYSKNTLMKEAMRYKKEVVDENAAWMEMGHPDSLSINPERICGRIIELWDDPSKNAIMGKAVITETEMGNLLKGLIKSGGTVGVSSRGAGSLKLNKDGINEVQDDLRIVAIDSVLNPSGINCFVNHVMESKEFALVNNMIVEVNDATEKAILAKHGHTAKILQETAPSPEKMSEEDMLKIFENLITNVNPKLVKEVFGETHQRETIEKAGYNYIGKHPSGGHILQDKDSGKKEMWFHNKGHAGYGILHKGLDLEFAHSIKE